MEKIKLQDVYLPVNKQTDYVIYEWDSGTLEILTSCQKHSNMVVLTKEQTIKMLERAMWEQHCNGVDESTWEETEEQRQFYLNQLFK